MSEISTAPAPENSAPVAEIAASAKSETLTEVAVIPIPGHVHDGTPCVRDQSITVSPELADLLVKSGRASFT